MVAATAVLFMARITGLEPQARHANRFNLYVDDKFYAGLSASVAARLRVGQELTSTDLAAIEHDEQLEDAHEKALSFLEPRPRSTAEVRDQLHKKKFSAEIVDAVVEQLTSAGLLDDAAFAKYWVENREEFRPRAGRALRYELKRKGLPEDAIRQAVAEIDEGESAYRAGLAKARRWRDLEHREFREKIAAFLLRRGFSYDMARQAAERLWEETRE